jgi:hypothetical protein
LFLDLLYSALLLSALLCSALLCSQVVNCFIQQKAGAGLHSNCVTHWDAKHDSSVTVKFENDHLTCVVMVFGISI